MIGSNMMSIFGVLGGRYVAHDDCIGRREQTWQKDARLRNEWLLRFDDVKDYEIIQDVREDRKNGHGVAKSIIGGAIFGAPGAIVGAVSGKNKQVSKIYQLQFVVQTYDHGKYLIDLLDAFSVNMALGVKYNSSKYYDIKRAYDYLVNWLEKAKAANSNNIADQWN